MESVESVVSVNRKGEQMEPVRDRYDLVAILLHWTIAGAIIVQLASGLWMSDAIHDQATQHLAYQTYQWHKALGLTVLVASLLRLVWRLMHRPPALPGGMKRWEIAAAHATHWLFYGLMLGLPLSGWAMVSVSRFDIPTVWFGLFSWPHMPLLHDLGDGAKQALEPVFREGHELLGYLAIALLVLHVGAALRHQFIARDRLLLRMVPRWSGSAARSRAASSSKEGAA